MGSLTKKERQFGKIITGFANAKDTYEAFFDYLFNTQMIIGPLPVSIEKAKSALLSPEAIHSLSDIEKELLKLLAKNDKVQDEVNSLLQEFDYKLIEYDRTSENFRLTELVFMRSGHKSRYSEVDPMTAYQLECQTDDLPADNRPLIGEVGSLVNIGQAINRLEDKISKKGIEKIMKLTKRYSRTIYLDKNIITAHQKCREVLEKLVQGRKLNQIAALGSFLMRYSRSRTKMTVSGDGVLIEEIIDNNKINGNIPEHYVVNMSNSLYSSLSYYLIEFLKKSENKKYIGQCDKCQRYFVATRLNGQKFCSDKCRLGWHNQERTNSGENAKFKRERKKTGQPPPSYYG